MSEGPETNTVSPPSPNLALVRTDLANERTLLAYGRTALMVSGTGFSLFQFLSPSTLTHFLGWTLILAGIAVGLVGVTRFIRLRRLLRL